MDGVLLVDKPCGPTSFDVVRLARRVSGTKRVGHTGTLDPLASGLLVVCLGTHTRLVPYLMAGAKRYEARVALGCGTDTDDADGKIVARAEVPPLNLEVVEAAVARFLGDVVQHPPRYSALKIDGQAAYRRARRGEEVALAPRTVAIHGIDVNGVGGGEISLDVRCGAGTYIRALARDLAVALGTVGHVAALRRTEASGFDVAEAVRADGIEGLAARGELERLLHVGQAALRGMPRIVLSSEEAVAISCGRSIPLREEIPLNPPFSKGEVRRSENTETESEKMDAESERTDAVPERSPFEEGGLGDSRHVALLSQDGALLAVARVEGELLRPERGFPRPSSPPPSSPPLLPGGEGGI